MSFSLARSVRILLLLIMGVALGLPAGAWAHAKLLRSEPKAGAVWPVPPKSVLLWFDDELDPDRSTMEVWGTRQHRADDGHGGVDLNDLDRKSMVARLRAIGGGTYSVRWRAVSADDGYVAQGSFTFTVRR